jgi:hypothetical protein
MNYSIRTFIIHHIDKLTDAFQLNEIRNILRNALKLPSKVKLSLYRPWRPLGLLDVEAPTFSDVRPTDGVGKVVSPTRRPLFSPRKIPGTHFC